MAETKRPKRTRTEVDKEILSLFLDALFPWADKIRDAYEKGSLPLGNILPAPFPTETGDGQLVFLRKLSEVYSFTVKNFGKHDLMSRLDKDERANAFSRVHKAEQILKPVLDNDVVAAQIDFFAWLFEWEIYKGFCYYRLEKAEKDSERIAWVREINDIWIQKLRFLKDLGCLKVVDKNAPDPEVTQKAREEAKRAQEEAAKAKTALDRLKKKLKP